VGGCTVSQSLLSLVAVGTGGAGRGSTPTSSMVLR
jgi:hypothetical protein